MEELATICHQMDDMTLLELVQGPGPIPEACQADLRRRLLRTHDPELIIRYGDPATALLFVSRNWDLAIGSSIMLSNLQKRNLPLDQRFILERQLQRHEQQGYERIMEVIQGLADRNPPVFWETIDRVYRDPSLGPSYAVGFILDVFQGRPEHAEIAQRYPPPR